MPVPMRPVPIMLVRIVFVRIVFVIVIAPPCHGECGDGCDHGDRRHDHREDNIARMNVRRESSSEAQPQRAHADNRDQP